jgi:type IX secretion system PorP/SprF family membrane protein
MKKAYLLVAILLVSLSQVIAQQDVQFSQYMLNPIYYNPASAGLDGSSNVSLIHRTQWLGYSSDFDGSGGAPSSQLLSLSTPFKLNKFPLGLGFDFINDKLGQVKNLSVGFSLAYHKELKRGRLSFAVRPGIISQTIDFSRFRFNNPDDPFNIGSKESQVAPDLAAGVYYSRNNYKIGVGVNHLLTPSFDFGLSQSDAPFNNKLEQTFNISGQYDYEIVRKVVLSPTILIKTDFKNFSYDLSAVATYDDKIWGGLSYRKQESIVLLMGYSFMRDNIMKVGYAFDYVVDEQNAKEPTSHEFFVRYTLPSIATGNKKIIRTPRFRF